MTYWRSVTADPELWVVGSGNTELTHPISKDDAMLFQAAPALLDALRWALDEVEDSLDPDHKERLAAAQHLVEKLRDV